MMRGSVCDISSQSKEVELLSNCSLVIWDEASMTPNKALHCVDRLLRDMTKNDRTKFSGKVILLGEDFRQVLPVVTHGGGTYQVNACLKNSPLWPSFKQLRLSTNILVDQRQEDFKKFLLCIGEETRLPIPGVPEGLVELRDFLVLPENADICSHCYISYKSVQIVPHMGCQMLHFN
ncbi:hypothetical protein PR048_000379 [Dryococelus australis]|uniref:ATP-dependent DNA helicase n=1 Tax=Dryococelus australis TaxID=614101 RepID=A0ABQ9IEF1_9NEOP|nr:hypothetical protein PR048_000379 [Dryococelus australis]